MQRIIYVPPGGSFEDAQKRVVLGAEEPFILASVSGLGGSEADIISSETVGMDGEAYHGTHIPPRFVKCTVSIKGQNRADLYAERMRLAGLLRPQGNKKGDLYYENDHVSVKGGHCKCRGSGACSAVRVQFHSADAHYKRA